LADTTFDIVIHYTGDPLYQPLFDDAAERWEQIIVADLPDVNSSNFGFVDDLLIDASVVFIDGPGGVLGQAGPDWIRSASGLPFHGEMEFDSADVSQMFSNGTLYNVILHEMGHILGIGTLWDHHDLLNGFQYIGAYALAEYRIISGNSSASFVPVENSGGPGTAGGHWEEDIFNAELMTGFVEAAGVAIGTLGSVHGMSGLALIRLDRAGEALGRGVVLTAGDVKLMLRRPAFVRFEMPEAISA